MTSKQRGFGLLLCLMAANASAGETWQSVFQDATLTALVDTSSFNWQKKRVVFRERHVFQTPQMESESLRKIAEVQIRRTADCARRELAVLSRAAFSESSALVHYHAVQKSQINWQAPRSELENKLLAKVCGGV